MSILRDGIAIGSSHFGFLGCSLSQTRNRVRADSARSGCTARAWVGELHRIQTPAKYFKRLGPVFSATRESIELHPSALTEPADDILGAFDTHVFTYGCGEITPSAAEAVAQALKLKLLPSAFQVRLGGARGVLAVSDFSVDSSTVGKSVERRVKQRKSMVKVSSPDTMLGIVATATPHSTAYQTRQSGHILNDLGVADGVFLSLQDEFIASLATMVASDKIGYDELRAVNGPVRSPTLRCQYRYAAGFWKPVYQGTRWPCELHTWTVQSRVTRGHGVELAE